MKFNDSLISPKIKYQGKNTFKTLTGEKQDILLTRHVISPPFFNTKLKIPKKYPLHKSP